MAVEIKSLHVRHSFLEHLIHKIIWIFSVAKMFFAVYSTSQVLDKQNKDFVQHGWSIFNTKDVSDFEWIYWKKMFERLWPFFSLYVFLVLILRFLNAYKIRKKVFIAFTITFLVRILGPAVTIIYLAKVIFLSVVAYLTKSPALVWGISLAFLSLLSIPELRSVMTGFGLFYSFGDITFYFQEYLLTMGFLRYTGCALFIACNDVNDFLSIDSKNTIVKIDWDWSDIICYNLYFPCLILGPFLTFKDFYLQFNQEQKAYSKDIFYEIGKKVSKCCLWFAILEVSNHFLYHSAMAHNQDIMNSISLWSLAGIGYICGQMFMVKYFILWTGISIFASLDHIQIPDAPSCISRIYLYSDMWKMFDRGLYEFLKWHIYIPMGGNRKGKVRRHMASFVSFAFILFWHGASNSITIWVIVNLTSLFIEEILLTSSLVFGKLKISPEWSRRFHSMINVPILGLSTYGTFIFLGSFESASIIASRIFAEELPISVALIGVIGYCMIQTSKDYENYSHAKEFEKKSKAFIKGLH